MHRYVKFILENIGINAMKLASRVAITFQNNDSIEFLKCDEILKQISIYNQKKSIFFESLKHILKRRVNFLNTKRLMTE